MQYTQQRGVAMLALLYGDLESVKRLFGAAGITKLLKSSAN
jgi:hypothetical protein